MTVGGNGLFSDSVTLAVGGHSLTVTQSFNSETSAASNTVSATITSGAALTISTTSLNLGTATVRTAGNKILCSERWRFFIKVSGCLLRREFALMQPFEYEVLDGTGQILGCCGEFLIATW